ncbi:hypothetical protein [Clostridium arbusti]|nr:hypothetical protein [Clostridium arbusti]
MLKVIVPEDKPKLLRQIKALEYQIVRDTNNKDKQIHIIALQRLKNGIKK